MQESPPPIQGPTPTPQEYRFSFLFTGATLGTLPGQGRGVGVEVPCWRAQMNHGNLHRPSPPSSLNARRRKGGSKLVVAFCY